MAGRSLSAARRAVVVALERKELLYEQRKNPRQNAGKYTRFSICEFNNARASLKEGTLAIARSLLLQVRVLTFACDRNTTVKSLGQESARLIAPKRGITAEASSAFSDQPIRVVLIFLTTFFRPGP